MHIGEYDEEYGILITDHKQAEIKNIRPDNIKMCSRYGTVFWTHILL